MGFPILDILQGFSAAKGYADQAQAAGIEAEMAKLRGVQSGEIAREHLRQTLGTISAIQAARGNNPDSPTGAAIEAKTTQDATRDELVQKLGFTQQEQVARLQQSAYRRQSRWAIPLGFSNAFQDAAQNLSAAGY